MCVKGDLALETVVAAVGNGNVVYYSLL